MCIKTDIQVHQRKSKDRGKGFIKIFIILPPQELHSYAFPDLPIYVDWAVHNWHASKSKNFSVHSKRFCGQEDHAVVEYLPRMQDMLAHSHKNT